MIQIEYEPSVYAFRISGTYQDLDKLYDAVFRLADLAHHSQIVTGNVTDEETRLELLHQNDLLLSLCYDLRKAYEGKRQILLEKTYIHSGEEIEHAVVTTYLEENGLLDLYPINCEGLKDKELEKEYGRKLKEDAERLEEKVDELLRTDRGGEIHYGVYIYAGWFTWLLLELQHILHLDLIYGLCNSFVTYEPLMYANARARIEVFAAVGWQAIAKMIGGKEGQWLGWSMSLKTDSYLKDGQYCQYFDYLLMYQKPDEELTKSLFTAYLNWLARGQYTFDEQYMRVLPNERQEQLDKMQRRIAQAKTEVEDSDVRLLSASIFNQRMNAAINKGTIYNGQSLDNWVRKQASAKKRRRAVPFN